jgi:hypothetical protein
VAERLKLNALLPAQLDSVGERARLKLCENQDVGAMKLAWGYIGGELQNALAQALDCDLMEMLARGWAQADLLTEFADSARHPAGERSIVEIGAHDCSRELKPVIAVTLGSCPCAELEFGLKVSANFGGVQLSIADGHITGGRTGEAWASAQLSFQGQPLHDAAQTRKVPIPGAFQFEAPGIPISAASL